MFLAITLGISIALLVFTLLVVASFPLLVVASLLVSSVVSLSVLVGLLILALLSTIIAWLVTISLDIRFPLWASSLFLSIVSIVWLALVDSLVTVFLTAALGACLSVLSSLGRLVELHVLWSLSTSLRQWHLLYHLLQEFLYLLEPVHIHLVDQCDGSTITVGTSGTTDTVYIVLGVVRYIEVDDKCDVIDVDATSHDVGSHEYIYLSTLKLEHDVVTLSLCEVGVHSTTVNFLLG